MPMLLNSILSAISVFICGESKDDSTIRLIEALAASRDKCTCTAEFLLVGPNNGVTESHTQFVNLEAAIKAAQYEWLLFYQGLDEPDLGFFNQLLQHGPALDAAGAGLIGTLVQGNSNTLYWRPCAASKLLSQIVSCHLLVRRDVFQALCESNLAVSNISRLEITDLTLHLLAGDCQCHFIITPSKTRIATTVRLGQFSLTQAFRNGWNQATRLHRYPALRRLGVPGLAIHLVICSVLAIAGAFTGQFILLLMPPLFLATTMLLSILKFTVDKLSAPRFDNPLLRVFVDLPFGCGQIVNAMVKLSMRDGVCRLDSDDDATSRCFAVLVESLWCDHLALLLTVGLLAILL